MKVCISCTKIKDDIYEHILGDCLQGIRFADALLAANRRMECLGCNHIVATTIMSGTCQSDRNISDFVGAVVRRICCHYIGQTRDE
jgi:hypothetical protein